MNEKNTSEAEQLARTFHEIYERRAPDFGYEEVRVFDLTSRHGRLLIDVCREIRNGYIKSAIEKALDENNLAWGKRAALKP